MRRRQPLIAYSNAYECLPASISIVILPEIPDNSPLPESGTTVTDSPGVPRFIVPLCCRMNVPRLPYSVPFTRTIAI